MPRTTTRDTTALVAAVKDYALAHYNDGGWDVVVECWDDADVRQAIGNARTTAGAIRQVRRIVDVYDDQQQDAINSAF